MRLGRAFRIPPTQPLGTSRVVGVGTATIEYFLRGEGPTVILLPALAASANDFNELAADLNTAGYRTAAIELPGVGRSHCRLLPRPTLRDFADYVAAVANDLSLGSSDPVHVIGRGLGNRVARCFAAKYPERTASVTLLAAGGKNRTFPPLDVILGYLILLLPRLPLRIRRRILESLLCARHNVLPDRFCLRPRLKAMVRQISAARRASWQEWWHGGTAPLLVIQGAKDRVAPAVHAKELKRTFPERVELVLVPDAGHAVLFEHPQLVLRHIVAFLGKFTSPHPSATVAVREPLPANTKPPSAPG